MDLLTLLDGLPVPIDQRKVGALFEFVTVPAIVLLLIEICIRFRW